MGSDRAAYVAVVTPVIGRHEVEQFRTLVANRLGLVFDDAKLGMLADVLRRQIETNGAPELYLGRLATQRCPPNVWGALAQELTVTETYFYRSAEQIRAFVELALPQRLAAHTEARKVRVLSAGCASGEEPCSLAIAIREHIAELADTVSITGVDVNPAILDKARRGIYSIWSLRELPAPLRARWFKTEANTFVLDPVIRRAVSFEERNLVHADSDFWRPQTWDIVFCRNVLMYFDPAVAQTIVARIARTLVPGGYLFLGYAETLRGLSNDFHLCHTHETFYYRRKEDVVGMSAMEVATPPPHRLAWLAPANGAALWTETVQRAAERIDALAEACNALSAPVQRAPDLTRALELLHGEQFECALTQLEALPAEQARDPEALLLRAVSLLHSGAFSLAEQTCRELIESDELNAGAHYVLALCREAGADLASAAGELQTALYLDPGFAMARLRLGILARRRSQNQTARRELGQALRLLQQEHSSRILLFGGGFGRQALITLCRGELDQCGDPV